MDNFAFWNYYKLQKRCIVDAVEFVYFIYPILYALIGLLGFNLENILAG